MTFFILSSESLNSAKRHLVPVIGQGLVPVIGQGCEEVGAIGVIAR